MLELIGLFMIGGLSAFLGLIEDPQPVEPDPTRRPLRDVLKERGWLDE